MLQYLKDFSVKLLYSHKFNDYGKLQFPALDNNIFYIAVYVNRSRLIAKLLVELLEELSKNSALKPEPLITELASTLSEKIFQMTKVFVIAWMIN